MTKAQFDNTIAAIDAINTQDPNKITINGTQYPKELLYSKRLTEMLQRYLPNASEALQIAARAQHIERWVMPRSDYPMTKPGYMQWRGKLKLYHAKVAEHIMRENGYTDEMVSQVGSLIKKENLKNNADAQALEDVIVLAFLAHDLEAFVEKYKEYPEKKFIDILRKSYKKMSPKGQQAALSLITIPEHLMPVVKKAVA